jgi:hypothetical protein
VVSAGTQAHGALPDTAAERRTLVKNKGEPEQKTRLSEVVWDLAELIGSCCWRGRSAVQMLRGKRV